MTGADRECLPSEVCVLCEAQHAVLPHGDLIDANKALRTTSNFVVMPALGPLSVGHVMAVTREHSTGLLQATPRILSEYETLSGDLRDYCAVRGLSLLEAEHGGAGQSQLGPCVAHTHIHLLPGHGQLVDVLSGEYPAAAESWARHASAYMWLRNGGTTFIHNAEHARGQALRRALAGAIGVEVWDWAIDPAWETISETVAFWIQP